MKKNFKYIITLSLCTLFSVSCQRDLLSPTPQTSVTDASAFDTPSRILSQVMSLYGALKSGQFYGGRAIVYGDIRGEDFINETTNLVTSSDVWNNNPTNSATAVVNLWSQAYYTINICNIFLEGMASKGTAVVGASLAANYIAEAKLVRALCYYTLLQYYARPYADGNGAKPGVPLRLTAIKGAGFSDLARSTVADVYTQILKDLNDAETGLPLTNGTATLNTTRAHRNTAIALKTRVYLSMRQYANVITEANKIVSATAPFTATTGVAHALQPSIATVFTNYTTTESILSLPMSATSGDNPGTQNQLGFYFYNNGSVGSAEFSMNNTTGIITSTAWSATDKRRAFIYTNTANNKRYLAKYVTPSPYTDFPIVIRYAEVLLNLAEAKVRVANAVDAQAVALLSAVRNRSDAAVTYTTADFANATALINAILLERRIEFMGEGLRNGDLMRLLQTIPAKGSAAAKAPSDLGYIWPISNTELSLNKLCTDN